MAVDFGSDLSCTDDLDPGAKEVSGEDALAQALYRRLTTPRGQLIDDPDYGLDIQSFLHRGITAGELRGIEGAIRAEVLKDDRVANFTAKATTSDGGASMEVNLVITTGTGPFRLIFQLTSETVELVKEGV